MTPTIRGLVLAAGIAVAMAGCRSSVENEVASGLPPAAAPIAPYDTVPSTAATTQCTVESVTDGDTFRCVGGVRVRLLTIDTPEMLQSRYGALARGKLVELLPIGETVTL